MNLLEQFNEAMDSNQRTTTLQALKAVNLRSASLSEFVALINSKSVSGHMDITLGEIFSESTKPKSTKPNQLSSSRGKKMLEYMDAVVKSLKGTDLELTGSEVKEKAEKVLGQEVSTSTHQRAMALLTKGKNPQVLPLHSSKYRKYVLA